MKWTRILPFVGLAIFIFLLTRINLKEFYTIITTANPLFIILAVILTFVQVIIAAYKWNILLTLQGIKIHFKKILNIQLKSIFYGSITPGRVGSFSKIPHLKKASSYSLTLCAPSVIIDRFLDTITVALLGLSGAILIITNNNFIVYELGILAIGAIILFLIFLDKKLMRFVLNIFFKIFIAKKLKKIVDETFEEFYENIPTKKDLIIPFLLSALTWVLTYTISYLIALAIHVNIGYILLITIYPIGTLAGMIPITIAGLGTREAALIGILSIYGISAEHAVAISLLGFVFSNMIPAVLGGILSIKDGN